MTAVAQRHRAVGETTAPVGQKDALEAGNYSAGVKNATYVPSPWFRFFAPDFMQKTVAISPAATGVCIKILCHLHLRGEPLNLDIKRLSRLCGGMPTRVMQEAINTLMAEGLLSMEAGGLWSPLIETEITYRTEKSQAYAKNARKEGKKSEQNQGSKKTIADKSIDIDIRGGADSAPPTHSDTSSSTINGDHRSTFERSSEGARPQGAPSPTEQEPPSAFCVGDYQIDPDDDCPF